MRYKMTKNIKFVITRFVFKLKIHQNPFGLRPRTQLGELTTLPQTPSRLGRGIPPPHFPPRSTPSAFRTRRLRRLGSQAPSTQNPGYASYGKIIRPNSLLFHKFVWRSTLMRRDIRSILYCKHRSIARCASKRTFKWVNISEIYQKLSGFDITVHALVQATPRATEVGDREDKTFNWTSCLNYKHTNFRSWTQQISGNVLNWKLTAHDTSCNNTITCESWLKTKHAKHRPTGQHVKTQVLG